ncbi:MAG: hypothetical protein ACFFG0_28235 [Candidatus Thorarchaeota archaeon]
MSETTYRLRFNRSNQIPTVKDHYFYLSTSEMHKTIAAAPSEIGKT